MQNSTKSGNGDRRSVFGQCVVVALLICCSAWIGGCVKLGDTAHADAFLEYFDSSRADCIRNTMPADRLDATLGAMIASEVAADPKAMLAALAGCAPAAQLRRGVGRIALEAFPQRSAPYGIDSAATPEDAEDVHTRVAGYPFELAGRSRYRGVKRRLVGRYKVAFRSSDGVEPVHELEIEDIRASGRQPDGWTAADVIGSMILDKGVASVKGGRDKKLVWVVFELGEGEDRRRKVVWGKVDGSMVFSLEGNKGELMSAIVKELSAKERS